MNAMQQGLQQLKQGFPRFSEIEVIKRHCVDPRIERLMLQDGMPLSYLLDIGYAECIMTEDLAYMPQSKIFTPGDAPIHVKQVIRQLVQIALTERGEAMFESRRLEKVLPPPSQSPQRQRKRF